MWILEMTATNMSKIVKIRTLRNSQIVFSRGRGFIFQGFRHLQTLAKKTKKMEAGMSSKSKKMWSRGLRKTHLKHIFKKTMKKLFFFVIVLLPLG